MQTINPSRALFPDLKEVMKLEPHNTQASKDIVRLTVVRASMAGTVTIRIHVHIEATRARQGAVPHIQSAHSSTRDSEDGCTGKFKNTEKKKIIISYCRVSIRLPSRCGGWTLRRLAAVAARTIWTMLHLYQRQRL